MTQSELKEIYEFADRRDQTLYEWLRFIILLGSGALSLLVPLLQGHNNSSSTWLKCTWISLGIGIITASIRLYVQVLTKKQLVKKLIQLRKEYPATNGISQKQPFGYNPPKPLIYCEHICYVSFMLAIVSLVVFAVSC